MAPKAIVMVLLLYSAGHAEPPKHCKQVSDAARSLCSNGTHPASCVQEK